MKTDNAFPFPPMHTSAKIHGSIATPLNVFPVSGSGINTVFKQL